MPRVTPYLQLTRAHTAPLEMVPAIVGARLATGSFLNWEVAIWAVFGLLYHLTGYGMNSLSDWELGHDKDDPNKQHHPLNTEVLTLTQARVAIAVLAILTVAWYGINARDGFVSVFLIVLMVVSGVMYNYLGKVTLMKPVPISFAHALVFVVAYYSTGGMSPEILLAGFGYVFTWVFFQIGVSGELKDVIQDDVNLLRQLGITSDGGMFEPSYSVLGFAMSLRVLVIINGMMVALVAGVSEAVFFLTFGILLASMFVTSRMLQSGPYKRSERVAQMSVVEMLTAAAMVLAVTNQGDILISAGIVVASIMWVLALNRIEWGTWVAPAV